MNSPDMQLRVRKNSHKIRKPPVPPPPAVAQPRHHPPPPPPVIIYTESPKIIHVDRNEFKSLVQRLTGSNPSSSTSANISPPSRDNDGGASAAAQTWEQSSGVLPAFPQNLFLSSSDSNMDLLNNMRENNSIMPNDLIKPHMMNTTPSTKSVDIFSTLFDL